MTSTSPHDPTTLRTHLRALLDHNTGGWSIREIAETCGLGISTIQTLAGDYPSAARRTVTAHTWTTISALQPRNRPRATAICNTPATEAIRIVRGLVTQGWQLCHLEQLAGITRLDRFAVGNMRTCRVETVDKLRRVADKLGGYDLTRMDNPMPGMSDQAAAAGANRGWVPLRAWTDTDITDPNAQPWSVDNYDDDDEPVYAFVDQVLLVRVREAVEKLADFPDQRFRAAQWAAHPLTSITVLEAYAVVAAGVEYGMSSTELAILLGFPATALGRRESGERAVARIRQGVKRFREWADQSPTGQPPVWFNDAQPSRKLGFTQFVPALLAIQNPPWGLGWDVAQLAAWCAVPEARMREFLVQASVQADRPFRPQAEIDRTGIRRSVAGAGGLSRRCEQVAA